MFNSDVLSVVLRFNSTIERQRFRAINQTFKKAAEDYASDNAISDEVALLGIKNLRTGLFQRMTSEAPVTIPRGLFFKQDVLPHFHEILPKPVYFAYLQQFNFYEKAKSKQKKLASKAIPNGLKTRQKKMLIEKKQNLEESLVEIEHALQNEPLCQKNISQYRSNGKIYANDLFDFTATITLHFCLFLSLRLSWNDHDCLAFACFGLIFISLSTAIIDEKYLDGMLSDYIKPVPDSKFLL